MPKVATTIARRVIITATAAIRHQNRHLSRASFTARRERQLLQTVPLPALKARHPSVAEIPAMVRTSMVTVMELAVRAVREMQVQRHAVFQARQ